MRKLSVRHLTEAVRELVVSVNRELPTDVAEAIRVAWLRETCPPAKEALQQLLENMQIALEDGIPLCQDTGMFSVHLTVGQDVHFTDGDLRSAINEGVHRGTMEGYLRQSMVSDPLFRKNTEDNTPAFLHIDIVPGDVVMMTVTAKGAGSENMSRVQMLTPDRGRVGIIDFVVDTIRQAGAKPCPPLVIGVGMGGNFATVTGLAKKALLRPLNSPHTDPYYRELEEILLTSINALKIGVNGYGGLTTALSVKIEKAACHLACLPVAVNINCHSARRAEREV